MGFTDTKLKDLYTGARIGTANTQMHTPEPNNLGAVRLKFKNNNE